MPRQSPHVPVQAHRWLQGPCVDAALRGRGRSFHVLNHHAEDGISLDTFVDWIRSAGYRVERVPDHAQWLQSFEAKLRALPEEQRQHSSLTVLESLSHPYKSSEPMVGSKRFEGAVRRLRVGPEVPHLTQEFIEKCLDDMRRLDLIPAPGADADVRERQAMASASPS
jgi:fatty acid CoA ligase FadD9